MPLPPAIPKPKPTLARAPQEAAELFLASRRLQDVANVLEVHPGHLQHWLYARPAHAGYVVFEIPKKSGGSRRISAPPAAIKILQLKFKSILDCLYRPKRCVFGFIKGRSIVDGAARHKKKARWILNVDIEDFYPSINFGRIRGLFLSMGIGPRAAAVWAHLVTCRGELPQGAPTSPVLSNMIAAQLDRKLVHLARRFHLTYTRYADDLSFSTTKCAFPDELARFTGTCLDADNVELRPQLENVIRSAGFSINNRKTRMQSKAVRQEVTGLTVNELVNVRRGFIRQVRAMIFAAGKYGFAEAGREYINRYAPPGRISPDVLERDGFDPGDYFKLVIYGKLAFVRMVRGKTDKCYVNLCLQMSTIDPEPPRQVVEMKRMYEEFDVFICHASEDKAAVAAPLYDALKAIKVVAFLDDKYISWGDSFVEKINHALSRAKLVVVVLSERSVDKAWPKRELNASLAREVEGRTKILPLMVGTEEEINQLLERVPLLKDKHYQRWVGAPNDVAAEIKKQLP